MIEFVGAGPGAVDLITVRGMKILQEADIIIYAGSLVNPEILKYADEKCRIYDSAKMNLPEIIEVMRSGEEAGLKVVRLHTGDPSLYGAIREQMDELDKLGIEYELCPGVSAYQGAAAALKVEYTLPDISQTVILSRASGRTEVPERENLKNLASIGATLVLYLSSSMGEKVQQELLEGGYPEDTPVAIVYKATWPEEKVIRSTLSEFAARMEQEKINRTALIIVGRVLDGEYSYSKLYDPGFTTGYRIGKS